jgi:uncharacterized protein YodC (DUF2158 family)
MARTPDVDSLLIPPTRSPTALSPEIAVGDLVVLKSGGPPMTVGLLREMSSLERGGPPPERQEWMEARCHWMDRNRGRWRSAMSFIPVTALTNWPGPLVSKKECGHQFVGVASVLVCRRPSGHDPDFHRDGEHRWDVVDVEDRDGS